MMESLIRRMGNLAAGVTLCVRSARGVKVGDRGLRRGRTQDIGTDAAEGGEMHGCFVRIGKRLDCKRVASFTRLAAPKREIGVRATPATLARALLHSAGEWGAEP